jgi:TolA-binding protein
VDETVSRAYQDPLHRVATLVAENRRALVVAGAVILGAAGIVWFTISAKGRREAFAARALRDAQAAIAAGNAPLAANDLARLVASYGGTAAAGEGALLLGRLRLDQGDPEQAAAGLREFLNRDPADRFAAPAYSLLGSALEQAARHLEAGHAHAQAVERWPYTYLKAQSLLDAGRTFHLAHDTARAAQAYQRIVDDYSDTPSLLEAQLRLGELRPAKVQP